MIKKNIRLFIGIIIGIIISVGGVYAASTIYSTNVEIDKSNGKLANVNGTKLQDALDYLYSKASMVGECPNGYTCSESVYLPTNDNTTYTQSVFVQNLQVGDLIQMIPSSTSFQTDGSKTGYQPETINPQELKLWRVIRKNTNGTVDIVSEYVSSTRINFRGTLGYSNFIGYLNELALFYENSNYTIGSRYMGYNGQIEYIEHTDNFNDNKKVALWTESTSLNMTVDDEAKGAGDMGYEVDYDLVKAAYVGTTTYGTNESGTLIAYKVGTTTATSYWLASRYYNYYSSTNFYFRGRLIYTNGNLDSYFLRFNNSGGWYDGSNSYALRPILTLKADVTSSSGDGKSISTAYVLS